MSYMMNMTSVKSWYTKESKGTDFNITSHRIITLIIVNELK